MEKISMKDVVYNGYICAVVLGGCDTTTKTISSKDSERAKNKSEESLTCSKNYLSDSQLKGQIDKLNETLKSKENQIKDLETEKKELENKSGLSNNELTQLREELETAKEELEKEKKELEKEKQNLEETKGKNIKPTTEEIEKLQKKIAEKDAACIEITAKNTELEKKLEILQKEYAKLLNEPGDVASKNTEIESLNNQIDSLRREIATLKENLQIKENEILENEKKIKKLYEENENNPNINKIVSEIELLKGETEKLTADETITTIKPKYFTEVIELKKKFEILEKLGQKPSDTSFDAKKTINTIYEKLKKIHDDSLNKLIEKETANNYGLSSTRVKDTYGAFINLLSEFFPEEEINFAEIDWNYEDRLKMNIYTFADYEVSINDIAMKQESNSSEGENNFQFELLKKNANDSISDKSVQVRLLEKYEESKKINFMIGDRELFTEKKEEEKNKPEEERKRLFNIHKKNKNTNESRKIFHTDEGMLKAINAYKTWCEATKNPNFFISSPNSQSLIRFDENKYEIKYVNGDFDKIESLDKKVGFAFRDDMNSIRPLIYSMLILPGSYGNDIVSSIELLETRIFSIILGYLGLHEGILVPINAITKDLAINYKIIEVELDGALKLNETFEEHLSYLMRHLCNNLNEKCKSTKLFEINNEDLSEDNKKYALKFFSDKFKSEEDNILQKVAEGTSEDEKSKSNKSKFWKDLLGIIFAYEAKEKNFDDLEVAILKILQDKEYSKLQFTEEINIYNREAEDDLKSYVVRHKDVAISMFYRILKRDSQKIVNKALETAILNNLFFRVVKDNNYKKIYDEYYANNKEEYKPYIAPYCEMLLEIVGNDNYPDNKDGKLCSKEEMQECIAKIKSRSGKKE